MNQPYIYIYIIGEELDTELSQCLCRSHSQNEQKVLLGMCAQQRLRSAYADQPTHPRSLVKVFDIGSQDPSESSYGRRRL